MTASTKSQRVRRWITLGAATAATIALLIAAIMITSRPRWRTYTFPANPNTGMAVAFDYPDGWQFKDSDRHTKFEPSMRLTLKPIPPTGITRWMQEKLLRQDLNYEDGDEISIDVGTGSTYQSMADIEKQAAHVPPGIRYTLDHRRHALGPALYVDVTVDNGALGLGRAAGFERARGMLIYPTAATGDSKMSISIGGIAAKSRFARFGVAVDQIIPRIHLVRADGKPH